MNGARPFLVPGGPGSWSKIVFTIPADGEYALAVSTYPDEHFEGVGTETGRYVGLLDPNAIGHNRYGSATSVDGPFFTGDDRAAHDPIGARNQIAQVHVANVGCIRADGDED
jgi:hypothetical protein